MKIVSLETANLSHDDVTDKRYQLEDKKRKLAQEIDNATKHKRMQKAKEVYLEAKDRCQRLLLAATPHEQHVFQDIVAQEAVFFASNIAAKILEKAAELEVISGQIEWRTPEYLTGVFNWLSTQIDVGMSQQPLGSKVSRMLG